MDDDDFPALAAALPFMQSNPLLFSVVFPGVYSRIPYHCKSPEFLAKQVCFFTHSHSLPCNISLDITPLTITPLPLFVNSRWRSFLDCRIANSYLYLRRKESLMAKKSEAETVGSLVRSRRLERELRQVDACEAAGITQAYWSDIETGRTEPTIATLRKIAIALDCKPGELIPWP